MSIAITIIIILWLEGIYIIGKLNAPYDNYELAFTILWPLATLVGMYLDLYDRAKDEYNYWKERRRNNNRHTH
jgi:hypothetical protein